MTTTDVTLEDRASLPTTRSSPRRLVRDVALPGGAGTLALITLDNGLDHTKPNTFGPGGLRRLNAALDAIAAAATTLGAVGVTGKPFIFARRRRPQRRAG